MIIEKMESAVIFTETTISNALATRDLMTYLRNIGIGAVGPASFKKRDRSLFLQSLDKVVRVIGDGKWYCIHSGDNSR
jgi:hypothetical protein